MHLDRRVDDFIVRLQALPYLSGREGRVMRDDAERARVSALADAPDVQIGDTGLIAFQSAFDRAADFVHDRRIHLTVQQDLARLRDQILGPKGYQNSPDDPHGGVEPCPAVNPTAAEGNDSKD